MRRRFNLLQANYLVYYTRERSQDIELYAETEDDLQMLLALTTADIGGIYGEAPRFRELERYAVTLHELPWTVIRARNVRNMFQKKQRLDLLEELLESRPCQ